MITLNKFNLWRVSDKIFVRMLKDIRKISSSRKVRNLSATYNYYVIRFLNMNIEIKILIQCKIFFNFRHEIVPRYNEFDYILKDYRSLEDGIVYSDVYHLNGIEWRLKIYPHGNGLVKETHLSVFLEMSKGFESENKYEYKI
jgi:hypothetical protein